METFNDIFMDCTSLGTKIPKEEYLVNGKHIVVDQGQNTIAGYTDLDDGLFEDVPAIIFGDHTRVIKYVDEPFFLGADGVKLLKSKKQDANYKYLYYALKNARIPDTGYNRHFKWLKEVSIEYPNLNRQQEIVEVLDKITKIIEERKLELLQLDELIKARFVELFGNMKEEQLLEDISEFVTVGIANSATHAYAESGIPMLRNQNIKENYLDDTDLIYIKPEFAAKYESKKLKENDIIAMRTGYPGIACLVPKKYEGCQTFTTLIVRLKADNNPSYVCSYINSDLGKRFIESGKVGVAQQNFGAKSLAKMPIKIAPKELQDEYADFVKHVDKSKVVIQKALEETKTLFDSLMQKYFG